MGQGFPDSSVGKESACNAGDTSLIPGSRRFCGGGNVGLIPGSGRSPGEESGNHSSILAWEISRTEKGGGLQSTGSQEGRT